MPFWLFIKMRQQVDAWKASYLTAAKFIKSLPIREARNFHVTLSRYNVWLRGGL